LNVCLIPISLNNVIRRFENFKGSGESGMGRLHECH
jgi:hypothetical protein